MSSPLSVAQLTGRDESHLLTLSDGHRLHPQAAAAFAGLQEDASAAGFELAIASSFRSYERQLAIFNGKACCQRSVHNDEGQVVDMASLDAAGKLAAIFRFSALPGASRHHWGTDLDVYDLAAMPQGYQLKLSPEEVAPDGMFGPLHDWLDRRMAKSESHGFYRPYAQDHGGVAVERWHLSFAPMSESLEDALDEATLLRCWGDELLLREEIERDLAAIIERYVKVPKGWCPKV
ncbi:MAG: M15 family metallopeptidase [Halioglobus sp.]